MLKINVRSCAAEIIRLVQSRVHSDQRLYQMKNSSNCLSEEALPLGI